MDGIAPFENERAVRSLIRELVADAAGETLHGMLLFGSRARGDAVADSDWDIAVLLEPDASLEEVRKRLADVVGAIWERTGHVVQPLALRETELRRLPSLSMNLYDDAVPL